MAQVDLRKTVNLRGLKPAMPIGASEVALLLGIQVRSVHQLTHRGHMPEADWPSINNLRAWKIGTVLAWARETDRTIETEGIEALADVYLLGGKE